MEKLDTNTHWPSKFQTVPDFWQHNLVIRRFNEPFHFSCRTFFDKGHAAFEDIDFCPGAVFRVVTTLQTLRKRVFSKNLGLMIGDKSRWDCAFCEC
jgi:hypothetical protein